MYLQRGWCPAQNDSVKVPHMPVLLVLVTNMETLHSLTG